MDLFPGMMYVSPFLFLDLGIFRHWFSVGWFRNVWCLDFFSPIPLKAPGRAGVGVAGGLEGGWLPLGFWLQCCVVTFRWHPFQVCGPFSCLSVARKFFFLAPVGCPGLWFWGEACISEIFLLEEWAALGVCLSLADLESEGSMF